MSFQFLKPQLPKINTQPHRYADAPVSFKSVSRRKQRKQMRQTLRANARQLSGQNNMNIKKKHSTNTNSNTDEHIDEIPPQFIPNNDSWHLRMNTICPLD